MAGGGGDEFKTKAVLCDNKRNYTRLVPVPVLVSFILYRYLNSCLSSLRRKLHITIFDNRIHVKKSVFRIRIQIGFGFGGHLDLDSESGPGSRGLKVKIVK